LIAYSKANPDDAKEFGRRMHGDLPAGWESALPLFDASNGNIASRAASGVVINAVAPKIPEMIGGSADLAGSNLTNIKGSTSLQAATPGGRNINYGIREHGMGAVMNGMALHGGLIPFGGTFLVFADYMRPAIRLAGLMKQQVIYVFTHDSIGLGEDGPTHQPVEQLTRQKLPLIDRTKFGAVSGASHGAYVLADSASGPPRAVILATGSEVEIALKARDLLAAERVGVRVVSAPSLEIFAAQSAEYRASVLPEGVKRVAIEAAHPMPWYRWVGDSGAVIGIETFGASAPYQTLYAEYGITAEKLVEAVKRVIAG
jgi:transketolase